MNDARSVVAAVGDPSTWAEWPGGWPDDIESALVDAVFSARAVYETRHGRGVLCQVKKWRGKRDRADFALSALVAEIDGVGPKVWASNFGNSQLSPRRRSSAPGGPSKAACVREAGDKLLRCAHVDAASDIREENLELVRRCIRSVSGIGYATSNYFLMLLGWPGVKPDRMVHRFLRETLGRGFTDAGAEQVVEQAAALLGVEARDLEHAIWRRESDRAKGAVSPSEGLPRGR